MPKIKQVYCCTECGYESPKWYGQCPKCKEWSSFEEKVIQSATTGASLNIAKTFDIKPIGDIKGGSEIRFSTGLKELDRVLGGGLVVGSLTLVGGDPGIGKSTLMLQICQYLGKERTILYVSGEESQRQIKLRADRASAGEYNQSFSCV